MTNVLFYQGENDWGEDKGVSSEHDTYIKFIENVFRKQLFKVKKLFINSSHSRL